MQSLSDLIEIFLIFFYFFFSLILIHF